MKKKKISNRILTIIIIFSLSYLFFFIISIQLVRYNYINHKYNTIITYKKKNEDLTLQNILLYSYSQGFEIGKKGQENFKLLESIDLKEKLSNISIRRINDKLIFQSKYNEFYIHMNPNIVGEITSILYVFGFVVLMLFVVFIILLYNFIVGYITKPLVLVSKYIDDVANFKNPTPPRMYYDDEVNLILNEILSLEEKIKKEIDNRNEILRAISHEFRTPLSQIVTILYLHENKVDNYKDYNYTKDQILETIEKNKQLIDTTLESFKNQTVNSFQEINVSQMIKDKIYSYKNIYIDKELDVDLKKLKIKANYLSINLIINNILSNMSKYSKTYINIFAKDNTIFFVNDFDEGLDMNANVGRSIIEFLLKSENIKYKMEIINYKYIIELNFEDLLL